MNAINNITDNKLYPQTNIVVGIDAGSEQSGLSVIGNSLFTGFNLENNKVIPKIQEIAANQFVIVVIEDVAAYKMMGKDTIRTAKVIGEFEYRLKTEVKVNFELIYRASIRKWVYDSFKKDFDERIIKHIEYLDAYGERKNKELIETGKSPKYRRYRNKDGSLKKPSFHYVDDRIVIACMKKIWNIPTPKPGNPNMYGFSSHAWQALALCSYYLNKNATEINQ